MNTAQPFAIHFEFDKHAAHPPGYGYDARPAVPLTALVWHSDEHQPGQSFAEVCRFGRDSPDVSWHYGVGPDGEIQRLLDPGPWRAWHAGYSLYQGLRDWNDFAVGIELYHVKGGPAYTRVQLDAAAWLATQLLRDHPTIYQSVAHRWIAVENYTDNPPVYGRKADPTDWPDAKFRQWVALLGVGLHI